MHDSPNLQCLCIYNMYGLGDIDATMGDDKIASVRRVDQSLLMAEREAIQGGAQKDTITHSKNVNGSGYKTQRLRAIAGGRTSSNLRAIRTYGKTDKVP